MKTKLTPYQKLLTMAKDAKEELLAPVRARQMRKKGELEVEKLEEKIISAESEITELTSKFPVDFDAICEALDRKALLERKKSQLEEVVKQMFP